MLDTGSTVVFLGPSLARQEAECIANFDYRPPAAQGDLASAAVEGARAIVLIDGVFGCVPSVWHKEVLWALDHGISVHGAASMGALRAAELHTLGMTGHGRIFADFANGTLTDDDEVAVVHAPAELGFEALSEAMVDIRATIDAARKALVASFPLLDEVVQSAKLLPFPERTYATVLDRLDGSRWSSAELTELREWIEANKRSQKREDAIELLTRLVEDGAVSGDRGQVGDRLIPTVHWTRAFGRSSDERIHLALDRFILDELRIRPEIFAGLEAKVAPLVRSRLKGEMAARGLPLRTIKDVRRQCRHSLDWAILELAREHCLAARFTGPAAAKMSILREIRPSRSDCGCALPGTGELHRDWIARNGASLTAMGLDRWLPQDAALLLGFDSLRHLDAALALEREFTLRRVKGGTNMTLMDTRRVSPPRWAVWLYMASENDPREPSIDFESAAQNNIEQLKLTMPFNRSEYFVATDHRQGPTFLHLFDSTVRDIGPRIKGNVGQNFSRPDAIGNFFEETVNTKLQRADKRMLVLWGHGRGMQFLSQPPNPDIPYSKPGVDNVVELVRMMRMRGFTGFQVVGLDCCFMAHLETMFEMRQMAEQIIAGPSAIPALSWPYDNVATLLEDRFARSEDDQTVAQSIAVAARESFIEIGQFDSPVLAFKTERLPAAIDALNALGDNLADLLEGSSGDSPVPAMARRARRAARGHFNAPEYVELESFANALYERASRLDDLKPDEKTKIRDLAEKVIAAARAALLQAAPIRGGNSPHSLTIWFPLQPSLYTESLGLYESLQSSRPNGGTGMKIGGWARFLRKYHGDPMNLGDLVG